MINRLTRASTTLAVAALTITATSLTALPAAASPAHAAPVMMGVGPAAGYAQAPTRPSVGVPAAIEDVQTAALQLGPWQNFESGFTSLGTCQSRRAVVDSIYNGYYIGGHGASRCGSYQVAACPRPYTRYRIQIRQWYQPGGPFLITARDGAVNRSIASAC